MHLGRRLSADAAGQRRRAQWTVTDRVSWFWCGQRLFDDPGYDWSAWLAQQWDRLTEPRPPAIPLPSPNPRWRRPPDPKVSTPQGSVHPYIRRRRGEEPVSYPHPLVEPILRETLGVPLWQEQGMRLSMAIGGFSAGEADALRRAMGKHRSAKAMAELEARFHAGAAERGVDRAAAETIWKQLAAFSSYGFPASHACSFALLTYQSAWLRHYYPVEFRAALLASQPMGFYSPRVIVGDARRHGIAVLGPDVLASDDNWTVERLPDGTLALRVGLRAVKGLGPEHRATLAAARRDGPFRDLADLRRRAGLPREALAALAACGALVGFEPERRRALWAVEAPVEAAGTLPGLPGRRAGPGPAAHDPGGDGAGRLCRAGLLARRPPAGVAPGGAGAARGGDAGRAGRRRPTGRACAWPGWSRSPRARRRRRGSSSSAWTTRHRWRTWWSSPTSPPGIGRCWATAGRW